MVFRFKALVRVLKSKNINKVRDVAKIKMSLKFVHKIKIKFKKKNHATKI